VNKTRRPKNALTSSHRPEDNELSQAGSDSLKKDYNNIALLMFLYMLQVLYRLKRDGRSMGGFLSH
jgi:hypothetical protein